MSIQEFDLLLRNDLATFIHRCFQDLNPATEYSHNWHLDLLADRLTGVATGKTKRLIVTVPPRSLKSIYASVGFPAWLLGRDPSKQIICASYGQDLSEKMARDTQSIMNSAWYQRAFTTRISGRTAAYDFVTTARGGRMATSVGGPLTGRGGDVLIIDDPVKPDEALSDALRNKVNIWYDSTLYSRMNSKKDGAIVLIMQRIHMDDLVGHVLEKDGWEVVNLPAIAQDLETWSYQTLGGSMTKIRRPGELLHPEREGQAELDQALHTMGSYAFSAQYLQSPRPAGGALVKTEWIHTYSANELPDKFDRILQSWDTASKEHELADFSVCTTWGIKRDHIYLLHVMRKRMEYPELKRAVKAQKEQWKAQVVLIEDKSSGTQLIQELRAENLSAVQGVKPEGDKVMRMQAQTAMIENGFVRFPKEAPWMDTYLEELTGFPKSKYKDQVDSTSQALAWFSDKGRDPSMLVYYKELMMKNNGWTMEQVNDWLDSRIRKRS
jgi:predicted phage terminase large subunit-like protein